MERTKSNGQELKRGFFSDKMVRRPTQGKQESEDKFDRGVEQIILPALKEAGYGGRLVTSSDVLRRLGRKSAEQFGVIPPRYLLKHSGRWLEIWPLGNPRRIIVVKPFVIKSTKPKYLGNKPYLNLPEVYLTELKNFHKNIWIRSIWDHFSILDLHFLIMTETGMFWLDSFKSIPDGHTIAGKDAQPCHWLLTYRNDPKNLDRIAIKAEAQEGKFSSVRKSFRDRLLTIAYFYNKNNTYNGNK